MGVGEFREGRVEVLEDFDEFWQLLFDEVLELVVWALGLSLEQGFVFREEVLNALAVDLHYLNIYS